MQKADSLKSGANFAIGPLLFLTPLPAGCQKFNDNLTAYAKAVQIAHVLNKSRTFSRPEVEPKLCLMPVSDSPARQTHHELDFPGKGSFLDSG